jgi:hypothetical protein
MITKNNTKIIYNFPMELSVSTILVFINWGKSEMFN